MRRSGGGGGGDGGLFGGGGGVSLGVKTSFTPPPHTGTTILLN